MIPLIYLWSIKIKVVILAGGFGTRLSEETTLKPKPLVEIGSKPILWHLLKNFYHQGFDEFIICCGYKGFLIKEFFSNYLVNSRDIRIESDNAKITYLNDENENWTIDLIDTGEDSMTGGRLLAVEDYLKNEDSFIFTYGDGLSNINLNKLVKFHNSHSGSATVTASYPSARFGALDINNQTSMVNSFKEKPQGDGALINAGFFVLSPSCIKLINDHKTIWEKEPLEVLASSGELYAYKHLDFWHPMDTLRDKEFLTSLWKEKRAPWKIW